MRGYLGASASMSFVWDWPSRCMTPSYSPRSSPSNPKLTVIRAIKSQLPRKQWRRALLPKWGPALWDLPSKIVDPWNPPVIRNPKIAWNCRWKTTRPWVKRFLVYRTCRVHWWALIDRSSPCRMTSRLPCGFWGKSRVKSMPSRSISFRPSIS